jgi:NADPH:quinone reductase-like Zn-dependent oxidoreductase
MSTFVSGFALRSQVRSTGRLELFFLREDLPDPGAGEIVLQVEAAPINPSDIMLLFGPADWSALRSQGEGFDRVVSAPIPADQLAGVKGRHDLPLAVGNEGAGLVIAAGPGAEHLLGKRVAAFVGGLYAQYRLLPAQDVLVLPDEVPARAGASAFVNPLTALGMVETMRREGHSALIHTAAASNLGQMLVRVTAADGIPLEGSRDGCAKSAAKQVIET